MFGGIAPDGWFGPWLSDTIIGFALPIMLYLFWTRRSVAIWGALVAYNAVGAFDYSQGLITQVICPMLVEMASAACQRRTKIAPFAGEKVHHLAGSGRSKSAPPCWISTAA